MYLEQPLTRYHKMSLELLKEAIKQRVLVIHLFAPRRTCFMISQEKARCTILRQEQHVGDDLERTQMWSSSFMDGGFLSISSCIALHFVSLSSEANLVTISAIFFSRDSSKVTFFSESLCSLFLLAILIDYLQRISKASWSSSNSSLESLKVSCLSCQLKGPNVRESKVQTLNKRKILTMLMIAIGQIKWKWYKLNKRQQYKLNK